MPQVVDAARQTVYVTSGSALIGLDPLTGKVVTRAATPGAGGLYAVSDGVALGLDEGALGRRLGLRPGPDKVIWTTRAVPWPHFFVDLSGIGGSADPAGRTIVLASCAQLGTADGQRDAAAVPAAPARRDRPRRGRPRAGRDRGSGDRARAGSGG